MEGGELFNRIKSKQQLSEPVAKLYFYQMLKAVQVGQDTLVGQCCTVPPPPHVSVCDCV